MEPTVTAKLFKNGNSQAVRLPKEFRFEGDEVLIYRKGNEVILKPKGKKKKQKDWAKFFFHTPLATEDFMPERDQSPPRDIDI